MQKEQIRPFGWGVVAGAIALLALLFATDWMVTASKASTATRTAVDQAIVDNLAPICVIQFKADPNGPELRAQLEKESSWKQYQFVADHGWSTMPGAKEPNTDVARVCAKLILEPKS